MNIIISGAMGAMGQAVASNAAARGITVVAGVDREASDRFPYPVFGSFADCGLSADAILDFSNPAALPGLLAFAQEHKIPCVIATTGMDEAHQKMIADASKVIPIFFTFNMSLGVNLLCALAQKAAQVLGEGFDIEIIEKHHNKKIDAPSGTAIMLANAVSEKTPYTPEYVYDRHAVRKRREPNEIGIHSVRGGTIVGEHEVIFAGTDEVITLSHGAYSKSVFAVGALKAAGFISAEGRSPGLYNMNDMISF